MTYQEQLEDIRINYDRWVELAYDYTDNPEHQEYSKLATFILDNLTLFEAEYNLPHITFFFHIEDTVNGYAGSSYGQALLVLKRGIIEKMFPLFRRRNPIFRSDNYIPFRPVIAHIKLPLGYFMFQITCLFAYYHERTHIIHVAESLYDPKEEDNTEHLLLELYEPNIQQKDYEEIGHLMELDADLQGAQFCIRHILNAWNAELEIDGLERMIAMGAAAIMVYWLELCNGNYDIYFKNGDHPHSLVRLLYITDDMVNFAQVQAQRPLDVSRIIGMALHIADDILNEPLADGEQRPQVAAPEQVVEAEEVSLRPVQQIERALAEHKNEIELFINELIERGAGYPQLLMSRNRAI